MARSGDSLRRGTRAAQPLRPCPVAFPDSKVISCEALLEGITSAILERFGSESMLKVFEEIDVNKNHLISFDEFKLAFLKFDMKLQEEELRALFKYFDKEDRNEFSYDNFMSCINKEHLNYQLILERLQAYLDSKNWNIKQFFMHESQDGQPSFLLTDMRSAMKKIGFNFTNYQVDELFASLDKDKDAKIQFDEFEDILSNRIKSVNISVLLQNLRRALVRSQVNILSEFRALDTRSTQKVSYVQFSAVIKKIKFQLSPFEMDAVFRHMADQEDFVNYNNFITLLQNAKFDIAEIREKVVEMAAQYKCSLQTFFNVFDTKQDRFLDLGEFDNLVLSLGLRLSDEELKEAFQVFDFDNSGKVQWEEFRDVIQGTRQSDKMDLHVMQEIQKDFRRDESASAPSMDQIMNSHGYQRQDALQQSRFKTDVDQLYQQQLTITRAPNEQQQQLGPQTTNIPLKFDAEIYIRILIERIIQERVDGFDLFAKYDNEYDFCLSQIAQLKEIFSDLKILCPESHIEQFYQKFKKVKLQSVEVDQARVQPGRRPDARSGNAQQQQASVQKVRIEKMIFLPLLHVIYENHPEFLMSKMMQYYMRVWRQSFQKFFLNIQQYSQNATQFWTIKELRCFNDLCALGFDQADQIPIIWNTWSNNSQVLSMQQLADAAGIQNIDPSQVTAKNAQEAQAFKASLLEQLFALIQQQYTKYSVNLCYLLFSLDAGYDFRVQSIETLLSVLASIEVRPNNMELEALSELVLQSEGQQVLYLPLLVHAYDPFLLFKYILQYMLIVNNWNVTQLFLNTKTPDNKTEYLYLKDFQNIRNELALPMSNQMLMELFPRVSGNDIGIVQETMSRYLEVPPKATSKQIKLLLERQIKQEHQRFQSNISFKGGSQESIRLNIGNLIHKAKERNIDLELIDYLKNLLLKAFDHNLAAIQATFFPKTATQNAQFVQPDQFINLVCKAHRAIKVEEADQLFQFIDMNNSGNISVNEFMSIFSSDIHAGKAHQQKQLSVPE